MMSFPRRATTAGSVLFTFALSRELFLWWFGRCELVRSANLRKFVASWLVGQDPFCADHLWQMIYAGLRDHGQKDVVIEGLSGIDIALWDIKGKHFGVPVHQLLGGAQRTELVAYATGLLRRRADHSNRYLAEEAAGYVAEGFSAVKLKVGFGLEDDVATIRLVREAIGPTVQLMVDANHAYDSIAAIRLGRMIEHHDIGWFEEPVPPEDIAGYRAVKAALSIPIAGGECEFTRFGFRELFVSRALDIAQPDTCAAGGLSECKKIADMAETFGLRCIPHVWGTGIAIAASLHLLAVLPSNTPPSLRRWSSVMEKRRNLERSDTAVLLSMSLPAAAGCSAPEHCAQRSGKKITSAFRAEGQELRSTGGPECLRRRGSLRLPISRIRLSLSIVSVIEMTTRAIRRMLDDKISWPL
ncbi:mandelate racemase/muconate lactonizing enzyme family protein [Bradyrhizobium sp. BEA-2-5]|uniref:mandelate racemase/muconate lactonizing enzyme family protein n=1 Tax=Bradyrhizobium sp. BEA-2-5 TaxID=3080015 RepID=UPI00293F03EF|nr:mandelate racemase/muconate lactonizing enzyme family protein [Bradyrhizobium sp. BEA-2-5]WOH80373.1 mandelate racemase/muconate lactonizing enzyme family protein [Bradyrhizobium sp. BEA-2-5]